MMQTNGIINMRLTTILILLTSLSVFSCSAKVKTPQKAIQAAHRYLFTTQQSDGSWKSYKSFSSDFADAIPQPSVYPTMLIARSLKSAGLSDDMTKKSVQFVASTAFDNGLWSISGKQHFFTYQFDKYPCFVEPDSDATALGWTLTYQTMKRDKLPEVFDIFNKFKTESSLFRSYFLNFMFREKGCSADYANTPSIGSNLNILTFLALEKEDTKPLLEALLKATVDKNFEKEAIYYKKKPYLAYLAHFSAQYGVDTKPLVRHILSHYDVAKISQEDSVQLSAYLISSRFLGATCKDVKPFVTLLLKRQKTDGSFPPAPIYEARGGKKRDETVYYGSPAETTALALEALAVVERCFK